MTYHRRERSRLPREHAVDEHEARDRFEEVKQRDAARYRCQAEYSREKNDQQQPPPEDGHRIPGQRRAHDGVVEDRAAAHAGDDPCGQAQQQCEDDGAQRQLDGGRKQGEELLEHRLAGNDRLAEIALQHAADVNPVLLEQRLVESVLGTQQGVAFGVETAFTDEDLDGIPRDQPDHGEGEQRDADESRNHEAHAGKQEAKQEREPSTERGALRPSRSV